MEVYDLCKKFYKTMSKQSIRWRFMIYVKNFIIRCVDFTSNAASNTASDDVSN